MQTSPSPTSARKADSVSGDLMRRIVSGELEVGEILPREAELSDAYGVNRSVIREAVKLLEVHRLVRPVRRRGTEVLDPMASLSPEVLASMLRPAPGVIDRVVLSDLLEIRGNLDVQMTALAADRRTDEDLVALDACVVRAEECASEPSAYSRTLDELALTMARATQNRIFPMLVHWHHRVQNDLGDLLVTVRQPTPAHQQGLRFLVELVRRQDVSGTRTVIEGFHRWATPRILAAAALVSGELP